MPSVGDTRVVVFVDSNSFCTTGNGDAKTIIKNTMSQTRIFDAIYVCGNYNLMQNNTINRTSEAAIRLHDTCNPGVSGYFNNFSSNMVNEACTTSLVDPNVSGANTIGSNISYSVPFDTLSGTVLPAGFCSSAGSPAIPVHEVRGGSGGRQRLVPPSSPR